MAQTECDIGLTQLKYITRCSGRVCVDNAGNQMGTQHSIYLSDTVTLNTVIPSTTYTSLTQ